MESVIIYGCPDGFKSHLDSTTANATCLEEGWILSEHGFGCYPCKILFFDVCVCVCVCACVKELDYFLYDELDN